MPNIPTPDALPEIDTDSVAESAARPGMGIPEGTIWSVGPLAAASAMPCITDKL
jgi:hypothetical protein